MSPEQFRQTREAVPFHPFVMHLADGRSFSVPHRDFCLQGPAGFRTVFVLREDGAFSIIDLNLVTELEVSAVPAAGELPAPGSNGG
jgi:hypothetical protein